VISSVATVKLLSVFGPNVVLIATSAASRPRAISHPADARDVMACIKAVPRAVELGFEPG
jgi:hypothetical protein